MNVEQEMYLRDVQIRSDREQMLVERDIHFQDQVAARARQETIMQREIM